MRREGEAEEMWRLEKLPQLGRSRWWLTACKLPDSKVVHTYLARCLLHLQHFPRSKRPDVRCSCRRYRFVSPTIVGHWLFRGASHNQVSDVGLAMCLSASWPASHFTMPIYGVQSARLVNPRHLGSSTTMYASQMPRKRRQG